jgi:hypothetical protein
MNRSTLILMGAVSIVAASLACTSNSTTALSPTPPVSTGGGGTAAAPLKATAPTVQSPINDQRLSGLSSTTLTATAATAQFATVTLQYRFQVFNDASAIVQDSGLVNNPTWTTTVTLTPLKRYTWRVRAEYQGAAGPWSATASFTTPEQPPAFPGPIGDWQRCGSLADKLALVICVHSAVRPTNSVGDFEVVKRVAWLLRGEGAGLLIKDGGENVVLWQGYSFSATRICYPNGHIYKIIGDAGPGGGNTPGIADNDFVDPNLYVPAIDPSKP